ncbi:hypothetical protein C2G38_2077276 [Gigaspora rosea]|uniref:Uncharacterized protein n=1 Tax=Gigaspora rosea TaxID=44941 RepID=A0A397VKD6_9GLOM|nr:hypothetical protein C2G38_2077276 [Gigaspora rosea]
MIIFLVKFYAVLAILGHTQLLHDQNGYHYSKFFIKSYNRSYNLGLAFFGKFCLLQSHLFYCFYH